jgi:hypothetical protein
MLRKAVEVVEGLGFGYALLHGEVPGKERRGLLERFRDDPSCKVFLSTDAGGTGLNLQVADTVINLEVPWNPAVLEQRIARVHRMGQHKPVQVFNLVMRDSIEERVLKVLDQKRSLFTELFQGTGDEVAFSSLGQQAFLEKMRELFAPAASPPAQEATSEEAPPVEVLPGPGADPRQVLLQAGVQLLEALATVLAGSNGATLAGTDPHLLQRGASALQSILHRLGERGASAPRDGGGAPSGG